MELLHPGMWHDHDIYFARDHSSKLLSIWENRVFLHFGDRPTDKQTHEQMDSTKQLSLSRVAT